jgi:hypothetical protein
MTDPRVLTTSPVGLARFCALRGRLSQWSYDDANGDAMKAAYHHHSGPGRRGALREAVGICTDRRHGFAATGGSAATGRCAP